MLRAWLLWLWDRPGQMGGKWKGTDWKDIHWIICSSCSMSVLVLLWRASSTAPLREILCLSDTLSSEPPCLSSYEQKSGRDFPCLLLEGRASSCAVTKGLRIPCAPRSPAGLCTAHPVPAWVEFSRSIPLCHHHRFANTKKRNSWKCILSTQLTWSTSGFQRECCERLEIATLWKKWLEVIIDT